MNEVGKMVNTKGWVWRGFKSVRRDRGGSQGKG